MRRKGAKKEEEKEEEEKTKVKGEGEEGEYEGDDEGKGEGEGEDEDDEEDGGEGGGDEDEDEDEGQGVCEIWAALRGYRRRERQRQSRPKRHNDEASERASEGREMLGGRTEMFAVAVAAAYTLHTDIDLAKIILPPEIHGTMTVS